MELDLEVVRWKTADDLTDKEVAFLAENYDKLNQEEKDAFAEVLPSQEIPEETPVEPATPDQPVTPQNQVSPEPGFTFKSQEEMDQYIAKKFEEREQARAEIERRKAEEPKAGEKPQYVPDDWVAPTWNDALEKASDIAVEKFQKMTAKQQEEFQTQQAELQQISQGFDKELDQLAKDGKIPDLSTNEGKIARSQIFEVGAQNGKATIAEAFDLWSKLPVEFGGGYNPNKEKDEAKEKLTAQKQRAGVQGGGNREPVKGGPVRDYKELHNLSMDELIERARA